MSMYKINKLTFSLLSLLLLASRPTLADGQLDCDPSEYLRGKHVGLVNTLEGYVYWQESCPVFPQRKNKEEDNQSFVKIFDNKARTAIATGRAEGKTSEEINRAIKVISEDMNRQAREFIKFKKLLLLGEYSTIQRKFQSNGYVNIVTFSRVHRQGRLNFAEDSFRSLASFEKAFVRARAAENQLMQDVLDRLYRENVMPFYETDKIQKFITKRVKDKLLHPRFKAYFKAVQAQSLSTAQAEEKLVELMVDRAARYLSTRDQGYFEDIMLRKGLLK